MPSGDRDGDPDSAPGVSAVAGDLLVEVEATNPLAGLPGLLVLDQTLGPLPSPRVDGRQVEAKGVNDLAG